MEDDDQFVHGDVFMSAGTVSTIGMLLGKAAAAADPNDAMKFSQAALNTANAVSTLDGMLLTIREHRGRAEAGENINILLAKLATDTRAAT